MEINTILFYDKNKGNHIFNAGWLKMKIEDRIKKIIENVLGHNGYTLDSIYLFGSRARGDFDRESDYDIWVIIKDNIDIEHKREIWKIVSRQLHEVFSSTPFDVIIKTAIDFEEERDCQYNLQWSISGGDKIVKSSMPEKKREIILKWIKKRGAIWRWLNIL